MSRTESNNADDNRGWSKEEREFCVESYYLNQYRLYPVQRDYWLKFHDRHEHNQGRIPSFDVILEWVRLHEKYEEARKSKEAEEERNRKRESSKHKYSVP